MNKNQQSSQNISFEELLQHYINGLAFEKLRTKMEFTQKFHYLICMIPSFSTKMAKNGLKHGPIKK